MAFKVVVRSAFVPLMVLVAVSARLLLSPAGAQGVTGPPLDMRLRGDGDRHLREAVRSISTIMQGALSEARLKEELWESGLKQQIEAERLIHEALRDEMYARAAGPEITIGDALSEDEFVRLLQPRLPPESAWRFGQDHSEARLRGRYQIIKVVNLGQIEETLTRNLPSTFEEIVAQSDSLDGFERMVLPGAIIREVLESCAQGIELEESELEEFSGLQNFMAPKRVALSRAVVLRLSLCVPGFFPEEERDWRLQVYEYAAGREAAGDIGIADALENLCECEQSPLLNELRRRVQAAQDAAGMPDGADDAEAPQVNE